MKHRILKEIVKNTVMAQKTLGCVLIIDSESSQIINELVTMPELTENGVTIVENIQKNRKAYVKFSAIYLVTPTNQNIDLIDTDFIPERKYRHLNIFFTKRIDDSVF